MKGFSNKTAKFLSLALVGALTATAAGCGGNADGAKAGEAVSYVGIDVNPSVSLLLDKNDTVVSVVADNEDAQVLLYGETLVGLSAGDAAKKIAELSVELGYLNEENRGINVTVEGKADSETLTGEIRGALAASAEGVSLQITTDGVFSVNRRLAALKDDAAYRANQAIQSLTSGEYKLILEAQAADVSLSLEEAAELSQAELLEIVVSAAEAAEPYATAAYTAAKTAAYTIYRESRDCLLESMWSLPYTAAPLGFADLETIADLATGKRINYSLIYNAYANSSRALALGLETADAAAKAAEETPVSETTVQALADLLFKTEAEKTAFKEEIKDENGSVTVASLDKYFNRYFKNMTEDERAAAEATLKSVMSAVQAEADKIDASIAEEYKAALKKLASDMTDALSSSIPESVRNAATVYLKAFTDCAEALSKAAEGKEPAAAAHAALETLESFEADALKNLKNDLTEEELEKVTEKISAVEAQLKAFEDSFNERLSAAEAQAKAYLEQAKAARRASKNA